MKFELSKSIEILERTPSVLDALLRDIPDDWSKTNEGLDTWSPYDIVGHFIHGEKTDWIPRMEIILSPTKDKAFPVFDRFAQFKSSQGKSLQQLLDEFASLRRQTVAKLKVANPNSADLAKTGIHPEFGEVTLQEHLSTWVVHDLNHLAQMARVMSKQYQEEVGPWLQYLKILRW
jgi:hypothetical protein